MSTHNVSLSGRKDRSIAWARIKFAGSLLITTAGLLLVMLAFSLLTGLAMQCFFKLPHEGPLLNIAGYRFDCTTWWGTAMQFLLDLFILVWGWDFVRKGRSMRQPASIHV